jgi:methoxymalonate biosynthesis protein
MVSGATLGAFALTEAGGGSSFEQVATTATTVSDGIRLDGSKCWVSSGRRAGVFLVFAGSDAGPVAVLVDGAASGLATVASPRLAAFRATAMSDLRFDGCVVERNCRLGPAGLGMVRVATTCLTLGRLLVAAGALSVGAAALDELIEHATRRASGPGVLADQDLVRTAVADAHVRLEAGDALLRQAAQTYDAASAQTARQAIIAKLAATDAATRAARTAVRLHGAAGLSAGSRVQRRAAEGQIYSCIEGGVEVLSLALGADLLRPGNRSEMSSTG